MKTKAFIKSLTLAAVSAVLASALLFARSTNLELLNFTLGAIASQECVGVQHKYHPVL